MSTILKIKIVNLANCRMQKNRDKIKIVLYFEVDIGNCLRMVF